MMDSYLFLTAPITDDIAKQVNYFLVQKAAESIKTLTCAISTGGGNVHAGVTIYNMLRSVPFEVTTHNIGNVDSIGNAIFLGGTKRFSCQASTFMFHGVAIGTGAVESLGGVILKERLDTVLADEKRMSDIISRHTSLSPEDGMALFHEQKTRGAQWALDNGFIDGIGDFVIPGGLNAHFIA